MDRIESSFGVKKKRRGRSEKIEIGKKIIDREECSNEPQIV
jgi:hypothetical protein